MTSGFNISSNITLDAAFHQMMGFEESEVKNILLAISVHQDILSDTLQDVKKWYNGYRFNAKAAAPVYNPDMVLYFAQYYQRHRTYPDNLLDPNIASDYGKIRNIFNIQQREAENIEGLRTLIETGRLSAPLTAIFSFERVFNSEDLISLLFYIGFLTIEKSDLAGEIFKFPNYVIERLYADYFVSVLRRETQLPIDNSSLNKAIIQLAEKGNP